MRARARELELIAENFPEGALYQYAVTPDDRRLLTYLSRGAERLFGELPTEFPVDIAWLSARIHPDDEPAMTAAGHAAHRALTPFKHEVRIRALDGVERWISVRSQPRPLPDGTLVWDGVIIDVTDRRRAEDAARRRAEFLAALNQTTLELLGRRNVPDLFHALADRAAALLKSPHAEIALLEDGDLVVRAFSTGREYLAGDRLRRGERALSWQAFDTRAPVVVDRYREHPESRELYRARGVEAAAIFPILRGADCVGILSLLRDQPGLPFTEEDVREGELLAQMAALVLHNAAVHEEAERAAENRTAALRESEERFRGVFYRSPFMIGLASMPDARLVEVNDAVLAAFGYTREEVLGRTTIELGLWVDPRQRERYLAQLIADGSVMNFEAEMRRKDGQVLVILHSGSLLQIGGRTYTLTSLRDITPRKRSEHARDHTLALMRATLESTADGILVVNADGRLETYNRNFAEMWGLPLAYSPSDTAEAEALQLILRQLDSPERFLASVRDVYSGSEDEVYDVLLCKDGRVVERFSRPQLLSDRPVGRVWSFRDTTEQRRAVAALRQSEERFRVLAEVSPVGIFSSDPTGRTVFVNGRWCELAGMTAEEAMGEGWQRALHPDDRPAIAAQWTQAVREGHSSVAEFRFLRPDGSICWLVGHSRAQRHADGTLAGYVGTITDVTELKRAEEARARLEAQQRQSRKMESLGTLAGGIAHDFNNILAGIFGFVELARGTLETQHPARTWLDRIAASSQRARDLVRQILTFSRKTEGALVPQRLHLVFAEALRLLRTTLPPMVALETHVDPEAPPVLADASQIHQVLINLCTNAWHALPPRGGRIVVTLEPWTIPPDRPPELADLRPGPAARIVVRDNGCGMDATTLEQIFEPFFTTKATGAGTGLGLAVVHGIVKFHQGAIVVRSVPGDGSAFELYFPAVAVETARGSAAPFDVPRGQGERVLVVDDDAVSGFALEKMTELLGYQVTRHLRPEDALAEFTLAPDRYDLVVSDLAMPGMNGAELIEHLTRVRADVPVIIVTGYIETARQRNLETIARAVLHKPVSREELGRAIAQHLRRKN